MDGSTDPSADGDIAYDSAFRACVPFDIAGEAGNGASEGVGGRVPSGVGGSDGSVISLATTEGVRGGSSGRGGDGDVPGASTERMVDSLC